MTRKGKGHSPNDMRSMSKNPNNPAHRAAMDNRSRQLDPQQPAHGGSVGQSEGSDEPATADGEASDSSE